MAPGETVTANFHLFVVNDRLDATQSAQVVGCNQRANTQGDAPNEAYYTASLTTQANANGQNTEGRYAYLKTPQTINVSPNLPTMKSIFP